VNGTAGTVCTSVRAAVAVSVDNFVTAGFQSFFSLVTNTAVAVSQSTGQSSHSRRAAAAAVAANCVTDFVSCFPTNTFVSVIQTVDEGVHDFRMAGTVVVAQLVQSIPTVLCIAIRHGSVDQLCDFACVFIAAFATGRVTAFTGRSSTARVNNAAFAGWNCTARCSTAGVTAWCGTAGIASRSSTARVTGWCGTTWVTAWCRTAWITSWCSTVRVNSTASRSLTARVSSTVATSVTVQVCRSTAGDRSASAINTTAVVAAWWLNVGALSLIRVHVRVTRPSDCRLADSWLTVFSTAAALAAAKSEQTSFC